MQYFVNFCIYKEKNLVLNHYHEKTTILNQYNLLTGSIRTGPTGNG